jgi:hypothetical protein
MRPTACALLTIIVIAAWGGPNANAEEASFWRWPFGRKAVSEPAAGPISAGPMNSLQPAAPPGAVSPGAVASGAPPSPYAQAPLSQGSNPPISAPHWMYESPTSRVSWPRIHMPEFSLPKPRLPRPQLWPRQEQVDEARNAWVQDSPDPSRPSPFQAVKQGAQRVGDSTRLAGTKRSTCLRPATRPAGPAPESLAERISHHFGGGCGDRTSRRKARARSLNGWRKNGLIRESWMLDARCSMADERNIEPSRIRHLASWIAGGQRSE